jgi:hypothetical protein
MHYEEIAVTSANSGAVFSNNGPGDAILCLLNNSVPWHVKHRGLVLASWVSRSYARLAWTTCLDIVMEKS